jgi:hypothetical protein
MAIVDALKQSYRWIDEEGATQLAGVLAEDLDTAGDARIRLARVAARIAGRGLPMTADLLVSLAGGSKTTALAVMRQVYLENSRAVRPDREDRLSSTESVPPRHSPEQPGIARLEAQLSAISRDVDFLVGQLKWIQRSIDTERQLAKLQAAHGTDARQSVPTPTARQRIGNFLDELENTKKGSLQIAQPPADDGEK